MSSILPKAFCGQSVGQDQLDEITPFLDYFPSRPSTETINIICKIKPLNRSTGKLKTVDCRQFLKYQDDKNAISHLLKHTGRSVLSGKRKKHRPPGRRRSQKTGKRWVWFKSRTNAISQVAESHLRRSRTMSAANSVKPSAGYKSRVALLGSLGTMGNGLKDMYLYLLLKYTVSV